MVQDFVGTKRWVRQATPYEIYMKEQGVPIYRGMMGFYDLRDLSLGSWKRLGARGAFLELSGCGGLQGMCVIEVHGADDITPEKHMYEEIFYVLEGRGATEVWTDDNPNKKQFFEWQAGSLFSAPLNTWHRIVNATSSPALLLGVTNAPPIFHMLRSQDALFNNPYQFKDRYDASADYFKEKGLGNDPITGRYRNYGNLIPDAHHADLAAVLEQFRQTLAEQRMVVNQDCLEGFHAAGALDCAPGRRGRRARRRPGSSRSAPRRRAAAPARA